jgi:hypothetical protein
VSIELLRQADYVLSACGRPTPPPGARWIDLPHVMTYRIANATTVVASRIENKSRVQFICRGVSVNGTVDPFRIWWANGRNLEQLVSVGNFIGSGAGIRTLQPEVAIDPGGKIIIESGPTNGVGSAFFYFWGVLRFPLLACGDEPDIYVPDISRTPRIPGTQNQNIMAPEWLLGNQCTPETPPGYWDEPFTLFSPTIVNPIGTTTVGVAVECPIDCDWFIVRNVQFNSTHSDGVSAGVAAIQIRMPSGYSLTNGDYIPQDWTGPLFPLLMVPGGGRIILDFGDMDTTGAGSITTTIQFDGIKRRRIQ